MLIGGDACVGDFDCFRDLDRDRDLERLDEYLRRLVRSLDLSLDPKNVHILSSVSFKFSNHKISAPITLKIQKLTRPFPSGFFATFLPTTISTGTSISAMTSIATRVS